MDIALIIYGNRRFKSLPSFLQLFSTDSFPETWNVKVYSLAQIVKNSWILFIFTQEMGSK